MLGIVLGVAVVIAIDIANASATIAFEQSIEAVAGQTTHQIISGALGLDEQLYAQLRREENAVPMAPIVSAYVSSPQLGDQPYQLLGLDPFVDTPFRDFIGSSRRSAAFDLATLLTVPNAIVLSSDVARDYGLDVGDQIELHLSGYVELASISGLITPTDALNKRSLDSLIFTDISSAQEITRTVGRIDAIDLIVEDDNIGTLKSLQESLPPGVTLQPIGTQSAAIREMTSAFRTNLQALSLLGVVVGMFLIYNSVTFSVLKRRPLFGTLRSLGVTRAELFRMIMFEALLIGCTGTLLGVGVGIALGQGAIHLVSQTLNDLYFVVAVRGIQVPPLSLLKGALIGVFATLAAAVPPARDAAQVSPRQAFERSAIERTAKQVVQRITLAGMVLIGGGCIILLVRNGSLIGGFSGTFAVVIGFAFLTPAAMVMMIAVAQPITCRLGGTAGKLAPGTVLRSLSRTSIATAALMIAISVSIGIGIMVESFRHTVTIWLGETLQGDIYVSLVADDGRQDFASIDPGVISILHDTPGVRRIDSVRTMSTMSEIGEVALQAVNNPDAGRERLFAKVAGSKETVWQSVENGAILVSEPLANRAAITAPGDFISLETPGGKQDFLVTGIYYDYSSSQGTVMMDQRVYERIWGDDRITALSLRLEPDADPGKLVQEIRASVAPIQTLSVRPNGTLRGEVLEIFDRTFAITGALQILATIVAFIGILSALLAVQLDNQREFGLLRAIGLTVRQLRHKILLETGLMGLSAGILAIPTGYVLSLILVYVINRRAFGWTLQMHVEPMVIINGLIISVAAALAAGIYPAWVLSARPPSETLRYE